MMLDQNENSEQLAAIKKKFGFDLPTSQQYIYYLNDLSPLSIHSKSPDHFTYYTSEKYGGKTLFENQNKFIIIKKPYLRESFQKNGKKVSTIRSEEHTSELQSRENLVCRLLLEKKKREQDRVRDTRDKARVWTGVAGSDQQSLEQQRRAGPGARTAQHDSHVRHACIYERATVEA